MNALEHDIAEVQARVDLVIQKAIEKIRQSDSSGDPCIHISIYFDEPSFEATFYTGDDRMQLVKKVYLYEDLI